jgi:hypothetical protein
MTSETDSTRYLKRFVFLGLSLLFFIGAAINFYKAYFAVSIKVDRTGWHEVDKKSATKIGRPKKSVDSREVGDVAGGSGQSEEEKDRGEDSIITNTEVSSEEIGQENSDIKVDASVDTTAVL